MTDLLIIAVCAILGFALFFGLMSNFIVPFVRWIADRLQRERGPWVVYRVAADGSGGVEFISWRTWETQEDRGQVYNGQIFWGSNPSLAEKYLDKGEADEIAKD